MIIKLFNHSQIGRIRRALFVNGSSRWNAWVRDVTAMFG